MKCVSHLVFLYFFQKDPTASFSPLTRPLRLQPPPPPLLLKPFDAYYKSKNFGLWTISLALAVGREVTTDCSHAIPLGSCNTTNLSSTARPSWTRTHPISASFSIISTFLPIARKTRLHLKQSVV